LWLTVQKPDLCISTCIYTHRPPVALARPCSPEFKERVPFFDAVSLQIYLITPPLPHMPYSMGRVTGGKLLPTQLTTHM